jgi:hypothetical protein
MDHPFSGFPWMFHDGLIGCGEKVGGMKISEVWEGGSWTEHKRYLFPRECWHEGCKNKSRDIYIRYGTLVLPHAELCPSCYALLKNCISDKRYYKDLSKAMKDLEIAKW